MRVDLPLIDLSGICDRQLNGIASDLVEQHASHRRAILRLDLLRDVPGDRFAFAVGIGRQKDLSRSPRCSLQLRYCLLFAGNRDVLGLKAVVDVDTHFLLGQIADVTNCRTHPVRAPEILADRFRFRRRLDDYEGRRAGLVRMVVIELLDRSLPLFGRLGRRPASGNGLCRGGAAFSCLGFRHL